MGRFWIEIPKDCKTTNIIPLFKKEGKQKAGMYRPKVDFIYFPPLLNTKFTYTQNHDPSKYITIGVLFSHLALERLLLQR